MKTNSLKYTTCRTRGDIKVEVKIRLNDECRNGHADFAITGTVYEKDKYGNWRWSQTGCCHEAIQRFFPKFKPFIDLHLCDAIGAPMYAVGNGFYHLRESSKEVVMSYLRITVSEYDHIKTYASDELYLKYLLYNHGIVERWLSEARQAITQLEALCGQTFKDESMRYQIDPLSDEERTLIESRIAEGYYTETAIAKRKREAARTARRKEIERLQRQAQDAKHKIDQELQVKLYLFRLGAPLESFIYYDHSNEVAFNWRHCVYKRDRMSEKQYHDLMAKIDLRKLPDGIKFSFKPAA